MTNDLAQAYHGVYTSSGEIMRNKQRHLYVNMLDLLTRTTRASGVSSSTLLTEEYVRFWYTEILPLVFDEDKSIHDNAVAALETVLPHLDAVDVQNFPEWPAIKATIVERYSQQLTELRQASNSNWYKIWCLLVRILNKEILKGASVINIFLHIVELGFRSSDFDVRAEAFLCWKVLVEIFAKHNEIDAPKRIKLICIPLKSSQSKTLETCVNKFKVWWYLICKLSDKIENYLDTIYEPFLIFCFGPSCKQQLSSSSASAQGRTYMILTEMATACLIESLGSPSKNTSSVMNSMGLERITVPLINKTIMSKCGKIIISACFESMIAACEPDSNIGKQIETLWTNLHSRLVETQDLQLYQECFSHLNTFLRGEHADKNMRHSISRITELLANSNEFPFGSDINVNTSKLSETIISFTEFISNANDIISKEVMDNALQIYKLKTISNSPKYWLVQKHVMQFIMKNSIAQASVKLKLWKNVSQSLVEYLRINLFEFRIEENAKIINDWILWPLESNLIQAPKEVNEDFYECWKLLMEAASCAEGKSNFALNLAGSLRTLFDSEYRSSVISVVLGYFILTLDNNFDDSSQPTAAFELIKYVLSIHPRTVGENYTVIIESLTTYLSNMKENQIIGAFKEFKAIFATIIEKEKSNSFTQRSADEFKKTFQDLLKSNKAKEKKLLKEVKDLKKNDGMFVIIPTVWGMNPDKLTEHQKEKMKEKRNDIPALYNDMSQSQEASIKPWTPKKIVIAKGKDSREIVIENRNNENLSSNETDDTVVCTDFQYSHPILTSETDQQVSKCPEKKSNNSNFKQSNAKNNKEVKDTTQKTVSSDEKNSKKANRSNESESILHKLNIQVDDEEKKISLLRQLKSIEIDTVEGNTLVEGKLRERRTSGKQTVLKQKRKSSNQLTAATKRGRADNENNNKTPTNEIETPNTKLSGKQLLFEKESDKEVKESIVSKQSNCSDSTDEVIEASQVSEPILTKKLITRKPTGSNICASPGKNKSIGLAKEDTLTNENITEILLSSAVGETIREPKNNAEVLTLTAALEIKSGTGQIIERENLQQISEMDTEPNTEPINSSMCRPEVLNQLDTSVSVVTYVKKSPPGSNQISDKHIQSTMKGTYSPEPEEAPSRMPNENQNNSRSDLNQNLESSPERKDVEERSVEFLNNTINISPILNGENCEPKCSSGIQEKIPTSPVGKKLTKGSTQLQLSPPERKPTNNAESPAHRPKVIPQFTGRGAQLINLIRNKRSECAPKQQLALMTAKTDDKLIAEQVNQGQAHQQSPPKEDQVPVLLHKDFLVFSKMLPSPYASPSASILKRKLRQDSLDDIESPLCKRKRVSFHDPPVSITKEYLKHAEEDKVGKPSLNRCLLPDRTSTPNINNFKNNSFKRKSRVDSMVEIAKFGDPAAEINESNLNLASNRNIQFGHSAVEMDSLKWNTTNENDRTDVEESCLTPSPSLYFADENAVLKHVLEKYSLETMFEKYLQADKVLTNKSIRCITKELSSLMNNDSKAKSNVLEILSEQHPREFLEHAIQENLSFVVCERLNYGSIVEYVCEKSKLNEDSRRGLLERIQTLLSADKLSSDAHQLITSLLQNHRMTDQEIVNCMDLIIRRHRQNNEIQT